MVSFLRWWSSEEKSFILKSNSLPKLSTSRDIYLFGLPINCFYGFLTAKYSVKCANFKLAFYVISLTDKFAAFSYTDFNEKIAFKISLFTKFNSVTITDSFWNYNLLFGHFIHSTTTSARWTKLFNFGSLTIAWCTCCVHNKWPLPNSLHTTSITRITLLWLCSRFAFITFTSITFYSSIIFNRL